MRPHLRQMFDQGLICNEVLLIRVVLFRKENKTKFIQSFVDQDHDDRDI
jgi:hypothetical protein